MRRQPIRLIWIAIRIRLQAVRIPCSKSLVSAGQVSDIESMLLEKPERIVGSLSHAAVNPYLAFAREFSQSIPQLVQRQVHRSFDATALMFWRVTDIKNQGIG